MEEMNLYTPQELIEKFPDLAELGWTSTKLGILFTMGILKGRRVNKKALITLKSFLNFVEYYNSVNDKGLSSNNNQTQK